jgi:hypothetical protein
MKILAIDPGGTTGLVYLEIDPATAAYGMYEYRQHRIPPYRELTIWLDYAHKFDVPDVCVVERFIGNTANDDHQQVVRIIGALESACEDSDVPFVLQTPAQRMPFREMAKRMIPATFPHARDAMCHALCFAKLVQDGKWKTPPTALSH